MTRHFRRLRWSLAAAALGAGALAVFGSFDPPIEELRANPGCPAGEVADEELTGWQCERGCPEGMLIDGETGICVAAPGVPPPALSGAVVVPEAQI